MSWPTRGIPLYDDIENLSKEDLRRIFPVTPRVSGKFADNTSSGTQTGTPVRTPKSPKKADDVEDFGFYQATNEERMDVAKLKMANQKALKSNPPGVKVVGVSEESKEQMAGYLFFKDTAQLTMFMRGPLNNLASSWLENRQSGFSLACTQASSADPSLYKWSTSRLFDTINKLTPEQKRLVCSKEFISNYDLHIEDANRDDAGYFCWIGTMHKIIRAFPDHFPEETTDDDMRSAETWYRCFLLLKCYWRDCQRQSAKKGGAQGQTPKKNLVSKPALKPRFITEGLVVEDEEIDDKAEYAIRNVTKYHQELARVEDEDLTSDTDDEDSDRIDDIEKNYQELNQYYKMLTVKGEIWKEATKRAIAGGNARKGITVAQRDYFLCELFKKVNNYVIGNPITVKTVTDNPLLHDVLQNAETQETLVDMPKEEASYSTEEEQKAFFELTNKLSSTSAKAPSYLQACEINDLDPKNPKIKGAEDLTPYPHQIIDVAWLGQMERSPIKSCLLAGECGSGKTITVLMHILLEAEKAEKAGLNDHKVTIIFAPSSVVDVWYSDWQKYFSQSLICRLFYGRDSTDSKRERCQIAGNSAEDFDKFLEDCRSDDPRTSRTIVVTSYQTWPRRTLSKVTINAPDPGKCDGYTLIPDEDGKVQEFRLMLKNKKKIGRVVADECHLIKNPRTFAADSILRIEADKFIGVSATLMINRINDMRGYLCQIAKGKDMGFKLPSDLDSLLSIYRPGFRPAIDFPTDNLGEASDLILRENDGSKTAEMVHDAIKKNFPIHILCPAAYRTIGQKSKWTANVAKDVLKPILNVIQLRRILSKSFETMDGIFIRPGEQIPHYTVTTVELELPRRFQQHYSQMTAEWRRRLNLGDGELNPSMTKVKQGNEDVEGSLNNEAYRGLMVATFDLQLGRYLKTKRKGVPIATSAEVFRWAEQDDDHGITLKYKKCRPKGAFYIPCPESRVNAANVHIAESVKLQAMAAQLAKWKHQNDRALVYFYWPICQWAAESLLVLLGFKVLTLTSHHTAEERRKMIELFRDPQYECDALLVGFQIGSWGLNFHGACSKLLIMEYPMSIDQLIQVFGRLHRLGQKEVQEIIIFAIRDTFDDEIRSRINEKYLTKLVAEGDFQTKDEIVLVEEAKKLLRKMLGETGAELPARKRRSKKPNKSAAHDAREKAAKAKAAKAKAGGDEAGDEAGDESGDESGDEAGEESGDEAGEESGDEAGDATEFDREFEKKLLEAMEEDQETSEDESVEE